MRRRIKQWFKLPGKPEPAVPCLEVMPKAVITMAAFHAGLLSKSPDGGYDDTGFECFWAEVLNSLPELETVSTRELRAACQTWRKICPLPEEEEERGDGAHETPNAQTQ